MSIMACDNCGAVYGPTMPLCPRCGSIGVTRVEIRKPDSLPYPDVTISPSQQVQDVQSEKLLCNPETSTLRELIKEVYFTWLDNEGESLEGLYGHIADLIEQEVETAVAQYKLELDKRIRRYRRSEDLYGDESAVISYILTRIIAATKEKESK